jgi:hypothetical protein
MSELTTLLLKLEDELCKQHEYELVKTVIAILSKNINESTTRSELLSKISDVDSIKQFIRG